MTSARESVKEKSISASFLRSRKVDEVISIRKKKRDNLLAGKRIKETPNEILMDVVEAGVSFDIGKYLEAFNLQDLASAKASLIKMAHFFTQVYVEKDDGSTLSNALMPNLLRVLQVSLGCIDVDIKFHALWCITNMAATRFGDDLKDLIPEMVICLDSQNPKLIEQVSWALGNLALENSEIRKRIINAGGLLPIIRNLAFSSGSDELTQNLCFCLANLLRGRDAPVLESIKMGIMESLAPHIQNENPLVNSAVAWVVVFLTANFDKRHLSLLTESIVPKLLGTLISRDEMEEDNGLLSIPVVRALGNLSCLLTNFGDIFIRQYPIALAKLLGFLNSSSRPLRKETLWLFSNLTAESSFIKHVTPDLIESLTYSLHNETFDLKREAGYAVMNLYSTNNREICDLIDSWDGVLAFNDFIKSQECELIELGLFYFQKHLERQTTIALLKMQESPNLVETLEALSFHDNETIANLASEILQTMESLDEASS